MVRVLAWFLFSIRLRCAPMARDILFSARRFFCASRIFSRVSAERFSPRLAIPVAAMISSVRVCPPFCWLCPKRREVVLYCAMYFFSASLASSRVVQTARVSILILKLCFSIASWTRILLPCFALLMCFARRDLRDVEVLPMYLLVSGKMMQYTV